MTEMSKEYGTALFMLAKENNEQKGYAQALDEILAQFNANPEYVELLASPSIPKDERVEAIERAFGTSMPEHVVSFLKLLCERGRIRQLAECAEAYNKLLEEDMKISVARVRSVIELTVAERKALKKKLEKMTGRAVELECVIDTSILGGLSVEIDGKIIDGSVRHRLNEMKDVISK